MRKTRKLPIDDVTRAALPTADRGELASIATAIPPLTGVPLAVGRDATSLGDVDGIALFAQPLRDHAGRSAFVLDEQNSHVCPYEDLARPAQLRPRLNRGPHR